MKRELRKQQILKRKNFLPTLLVTILFWGLTASLVCFIDPATFAAIPFFFTLSFLTLLFTFSLLFASTRRGLLISLSLSLFSILAYFGVGNILNLILILAIAVCIEIYSQYQSK